MKKLITFLIFLCLSFNFFGITSFAEPITNTLKQGIYSASTLNLEPSKTYAVQNTSKEFTMHVTVYDDHQVILEYLRLEPNTGKQNLLPIKPTYNLIIFGKGDVFIS
ncbi:hypothetical protein [Clostridium sp. 'White wine YQ']|uniref:hypothetical protein n=1 Tax=Clostridium sp. 'White wine YQ' TaxID=3027474 RepID=UPI00236649C1|nr:hypothetical protein [Clostridium sp. 'White wine YQ']MDD7794289.1 hypothetical protein [Clostridium sp. 'White wine YQ']